MSWRRGFEKAFVCYGTFESVNSFKFSRLGGSVGTCCVGSRGSGLLLLLAFVLTPGGTRPFFSSILPGMPNGINLLVNVRVTPSL